MSSVSSGSVALRCHQGEYIGIPPTGKSITYNEIFIARIAGGRIAETWGVVDVLSQMKQLGAVDFSPLGRNLPSFGGLRAVEAMHPDRI